MAGYPGVAAWLDARGMGGLWDRMAFLSSRDATRARYPLTLIWPADAELAAISDQWQRLGDGRIEATYNTPDELALCLAFPPPESRAPNGPEPSPPTGLHRQPAYVQPPLARSPRSTSPSCLHLPVLDCASGPGSQDGQVARASPGPVSVPPVRACAGPRLPPQVQAGRGGPE
jgi:hypothetical protein